MTLDPTRRLVVDLHNLAAKAREVVAIDENERVKAVLVAAQAKALVALLDDGKKKPGAAAGRPRRR